MRNKSRKRILHEQRVEIAKLRRIISVSSRYRPISQELDIVTLRRDFLVPLNVVGGETLRNHEAYKTLKEMMQHLVSLLEIRCEDGPSPHLDHYTVILRVARPSVSQIDPGVFMNAVRAEAVKDALFDQYGINGTPYDMETEQTEAFWGGSHRVGEAFKRRVFEEPPIVKISVPQDSEGGAE